MKSRHLVMLASLGLAAALAWSGNRANPSEPSDAAEPVLHEATRRPGIVVTPAETAPKRASAGRADLPMLALLDRASAIALGQQGQHADRLFAAHSWAPRAAPVAPAIAPVPPAAPAAPALPFGYIGRRTTQGATQGATQGGQVEVFLSQGDKVHVVGVASLIDNTYRVDAISATAVSFTYIPLNTTQQLSIGASD